MAIYSSDIAYLNTLSKKDVVEQAAVLACLLINKLLDSENCEMKVRISDEAYKDYVVEFDTQRVEFRPNGFTILSLFKDNKKVTENREFIPAKSVKLVDGKLVECEVA